MALVAAQQIAVSHCRTVSPDHDFFRTNAASNKESECANPGQAFYA